MLHVQFRVTKQISLLTPIDFFNLKALETLWCHSGWKALQINQLPRLFVTIPQKLYLARDFFHKPELTNAHKMQSVLAV